MNNRRNRFEETKRERFWKKVVEKRFYIVLLCCIMAVSVTYFSVSSFKDNSLAKLELQNPPKPSSTPLPDLTKNFPKESNASNGSLALPFNERPISTPAPVPDKPIQTPVIKSTPTPASKIEENTKAASANADATYNTREKKALIYPASGEIISHHSGETLVYSKTLDDWRIHEGIDIKASLGSDVLAADDGIIEDVYNDDLMGITIVIDHQNGLKTIYSNLSSMSLVQKGKQIKCGDVISTIGDSAICETGEVGHLHFEVLEDEKQVDPVLMLEK